MFDGTMPWHESWHLTGELIADPSSRVAAAVAEWTHPLSHEAAALRDLFDLLAKVNSKKQPQPYPRPWDAKPDRFGGTTLPQDRVREILAASGPKPPMKRDRNGRLRDDRGRFVAG